jgi:hypothetical protein
MNANPPAPGEPLSRGTRAWLSRQPSFVITLWAMLAAFTAYACVYAFRKPFNVAAYPGHCWGVDYKTLLVLSQIVGYTVSKFLGIKFVSEATPARRVLMVLLLVAIAEFALVLFALLPAPWNAAALFLNGLPLGMVWGLVFAFLEGRRVTEFMALGLSLSLIFSSAWMKEAGLGVMNGWGVDMFWMPAVTGALFLPLLLLVLWMLSVLPPPNAADIAARTKRQPMDLHARRAFLRRHSLGVALLVAGYIGLMVYRDVRDTFQVDILHELQVQTRAGQIAQIETQVGIAVIAVVALLALVRSNRIAFNACCAFIALGCGLIGVATVMLHRGQLHPQTWMTATGVGLYAAFIPYQAILFERLFATLRIVGTAAFLIALCDSYGYLATISLYFYRELGAPTASWVHVLSVLGYVLSILVPVVSLAVVFVFGRKRAATPETLPATPISA